MQEDFHFPEIDGMPEHPALPVPPLHELNERFRRALMNPDNRILRRDAEGNPIFGAFIGSDSNELITWGIITLGEWLSGRDAGWLLSTWPSFFSRRAGVWMNNPGSVECELWYLFYVQLLCGAVQRVFRPEDPEARERFGASADRLVQMARVLDYDFNHQSFRFDVMEPRTRKPQYRQPDSPGGYAWTMLFAALHGNRPQYMEESLRALERYQALPENPWYEIPNGSAALLAAAWHDAHGHPTAVQRVAGWVFDHEHGPLQVGRWGGEEVDGLMMGWRGDTREDALSSAYSMETLMPLQMVLPAVRYCPRLADAVGKYVRCVLSNFQLFYARGSRPLYETRPELDAAIPYERLVRELEGHSPAATGDFFGQRSVYGSGYLMWLEALARFTGDPEIFALDLSLTDWLAERRLPVFLLRNPCGEPRTVAFTPAPVWQRLRPELYRDGVLHAAACFRDGSAAPAEGQVSCLVPAHGYVLAALLPEGTVPQTQNGMAVADGAELWRVPEL